MLAGLGFTPNLRTILLSFTDHSERLLLGEEIRARNQQKHTLPLAQKLATQAASGGMCFVDGWLCKLRIPR